MQIDGGWNFCLIEEVLTLCHGLARNPTTLYCVRTSTYDYQATEPFMLPEDNI
jgi:hypothetical protein